MSHYTFSFPSSLQCVIYLRWIFASSVVENLNILIHDIFKTFLQQISVLMSGQNSRTPCASDYSYDWGTVE